MSRMIFVNLPVKDLERSKGFYEAIGFRNEPKFTNDAAAMMVLSDTISVMLLTHPFYATFTSKPIADAQSSSQVLLCISCDSRPRSTGSPTLPALQAARSTSRKKIRGRAGPCTAATSKIRTAISGPRCGWTLSSPRKGLILSNVPLLMADLV